LRPGFSRKSASRKKPAHGLAKAGHRLKPAHRPAKAGLEGPLRLHASLSTKSRSTTTSSILRSRTAAVPVQLAFQHASSTPRLLPKPSPWPPAPHAASVRPHRPAALLLLASLLHTPPATCRPSSTRTRHPAPSRSSTATYRHCHLRAPPQLPSLWPNAAAACATLPPA
jgi:hypothetical protein